MRGRCGQHDLPDFRVCNALQHSFNVSENFTCGIWRTYRHKRVAFVCFKWHSLACLSVLNARILRSWSVRTEPLQCLSRNGCERQPIQQDKCAEEIALMKPDSRTADAL